jgi:hypothetical protein
MKVDVLGLASSIKDAIRGPRRDELCFMVDQMAEHIVKLDAVVDALPKTADGVTVYPGMELYVLTHDDGIQQDVASGMTADRYNAHDVRHCYSTRAAVETASETIA